MGRKSRAKKERLPFKPGDLIKTKRSMFMLPKGVYKFELSLSSFTGISYTGGCCIISTALLKEAGAEKISKDDANDIVCLSEVLAHREELAERLVFEATEDGDIVMIPPSNDQASSRLNASP